MPRGDEEIVAWNSWAKRFNGILDGAFKTTFADFLGEAVHSMYHAGWPPELAAKAFIWAIHQVDHYQPVDVKEHHAPGVHSPSPS